MRNGEAYAVGIAKRIAKICTDLRAFQSMEYDPGASMGVITTEWLIPSYEFTRVSEIVLACKADEKLNVRRYEDKYKVVLIQRFTI